MLRCAAAFLATLALGVLVIPALASAQSAITIEPHQSKVTGKIDWINYTLTRTGATTSAQAVTVTLTPPAGNDWAIPTNKLTHSVTFAAGSATATLSIGAFPLGFGSIGLSSSATMGGTLIAGVGAVTGYDTSDTAEVEVLVVTAPAWVASLDPASLRFTEDGGAQNVALVLRAASTDMPPPSGAAAYSTASPQISLTLRSSNGTATSGSDFAPVSITANGVSNFTYQADVNGFQVGRRNVPVTISQDGNMEGDETFFLALGGGFAVALGEVQVLPPGSTTPSTSTVTYTATINDDVNTAPTAADAEVMTAAATDYTFAATDFNFADTDMDDALASVKVTTLPAVGELRLSGTALSSTDLPQTVTLAQLDADNLRFDWTGASGTGYPAFKFKVNDGTMDSTEYTMTILVSDRPVVANVISDQTVIVGVAFSFQVAENVFASTKSGQLTYSATLHDGTDLPSWLSFAANTRTFSGTPQTSNVGRERVRVRARDRDGDAGSDIFDIVVGSKPSISGMARVGQTLSAITGSFTYQWIRVDGTTETNISGASSSTYTLVAADLGKKVKVKVTFTVNSVSTEATSDAYPPHATNQPAMIGTANLAGRRQVWEGTLTVGAHVAGGFTEVVGYGWSRLTGRLTQLNAAINLGTNSYRIGNSVVLHLQEGDLVDLLVPPPGSLVFGLIGASEPRESNGATQELTAAEKAALRLHVGDRVLDFSDATILQRGGYEWQDPNLVWVEGDSIPLKLSVPTSFMQVAADPPTVDRKPAVSGAGSDGTWIVGESVDVAVTFSEAVDVDMAAGTPSIGIDLGGAASRSAAYKSGSGTTELLFRYTLVTGDGSHTSMVVAPNSLALNGGRIRSVANALDAQLAHIGTLVLGSSTRNIGPNAEFRDVPNSHDGETPLTVRLRFSGEPAGLSAKRDAASVLEVTGGRVTEARVASEGENPTWEVTVAPDGGEDVTVRVPARACTEANAICIAGQALSEAVETTVTSTVLSAVFIEAPTAHDGSSKFTLLMMFSHEPHGFTYRTVRDALFDVEGGQIDNARRMRPPGPGWNQEWEVTVVPSGEGPVTLAARATTDCAAAQAVCDAHGRRFDGELRRTVQGPARLSVADASVQEAEGATLDFVVTLGPARSESTTVDYATSDGTARSGEDYTAATGTLTFAANETSKTVQVSVHDDGHDDGNETMTFTLSNVSGAWLDDATATGTIKNTDSMPKAWMARFGRTVAEQVLDAVEGRMTAPESAGIAVTLAGERVGAGGDEAGNAEAEREEEARREAKRLADWLNGETDAQEARKPRSRAVTGRDLLTGSSFALAAATSDKGLVSLWGRGAVTRFDGREGDLSLDGEVLTGMIGADWTRVGGAWTAGLIVSHSTGEGGYSGVGLSGRVEAELTGVFPWAHHALTERLEAWGAAGYGAGTLTVTPKKAGVDGREDGAMLRADLDLKMASAGLRGTVLAGGAHALTLTAKTDAMVVETASGRGKAADPGSGSGADGGNLAPTRATAIRMRLGLEGSRPVALGGGAVLTPRLEVGVRHDGGDAETGFGLDLGGGLTVSDPRRGLQAELRGRGLLSHESKGFRERGVSGVLAWKQKPDTDRGAVLTLTQTLGGSSSGGADALYSRTTLAGLATNNNSGSGAGGGGNDDLKRRRLELKLGYGFSVFRDRFTWRPEVGVGLSDTGRDYSLGWWLARRGSSGDLGALKLSFEGRRRESVNDNADPEYEVGVRLTVRF